MSYGLVGLYGLYLIFVGLNGNSATLKTEVSAEGKGFLIWILAIVILRALYNVDTLRPVIKPFMALAVLTFTLKNYNVIVDQINQITGSNFQSTEPTGTTLINNYFKQQTANYNATKPLGL